MVAQVRRDFEEGRMESTVDLIERALATTTNVLPAFDPAEDNLTDHSESAPAASRPWEDNPHQYAEELRRLWANLVSQ